MRKLLGIFSSLSARINRLIRQEESAHPGMRETAAMVYIGDVYALRAQTAPTKDDGWGKNRYTGDSPRHL